MIKIKLGTNTNRQDVFVDENMTIKEALEANNVAYRGCTINLDGIPISATELNSTFADMNVSDDSYLIAVVKSDNA